MIKILTIIMLVMIQLTDLLTMLGIKLEFKGKKPKLTKSNQENRVKCCKKYRLKTNKFWNRIVFSDESKVFPEKCGKKFVRKLDNEDWNQQIF